MHSAHRLRRWALVPVAAAVALVASMLTVPAAAADPYPSRGVDRWVFDSTAAYTGWTFRNSTPSIVSGSLRLTLSNQDPGMVSPTELGLDAEDYTAIEFTMRNAVDASTTTTPADDGTESRLYFQTDASPGFSFAKSVAADVIVDPSGFHTYRFEFTGVAAWTGRISQIRFDPTQGPRVGTVDVSSLRLVLVDGPTILTTPAQLTRAADRITNLEQPFLDSWTKTLAAANAALATTYTPAQLSQHSEYFGLAREHSQAVRGLALAYRLTGDPAYLAKADSILAAWAANALASPTYPSSGSPHSAGLVIGRTVVVFADAYALLYEDLQPNTREAVTDWLEWQLEPIRESRLIWETADELCDYGNPCTPYPSPWLGEQYFNNHLSAQNLGILAIGYALQDEDVIAEGIDDPANPRNLATLLEGQIVMDDTDLYYDDPTLTLSAPSTVPGELYDRYRVRTNQGIHYAQLALRMLVLQAELVDNNNGATDWFAEVGADGESIELPFGVYDDILLSNKSNAGTGYYAGSRIDLDWIAVYELAGRHYPTNTAIEAVLESYDRTAFDVETFGYTLALTHGESGLAVSPTPYPGRAEESWTFSTSSSLIDWSTRNASVAVVGGVAQLTLATRDPSLVSPPLLGVDAGDYEAVEFRIRNGVDPSSSTTVDDGTEARLYWATDVDRTFTSARSIPAAIVVDDENFATYRFELDSVAGWTGRIFQLRFDPTQGPTIGTVDVEFLRLVPVGEGD